MKKLILPILTVLVLSLASCGGTGYVDPVEYNDQLVEYYTNVYNKIDSLETILSEDVIDEEACEGAFKDAVTLTDNVIKNVEEMGAFKEDDKYQKAALAYFKEIKKLLENDYRDIYELYKKPIEDWTDDDFEKMYDIWDAIEYGTIDKDDAFDDAQKVFADENDIILY